MHRRVPRVSRFDWMAFELPYVIIQGLGLLDRGGVVAFIGCHVRNIGLAVRGGFRSGVGRLIGRARAARVEVLL